MILPYILLRITKKLQRLNVSDGKEGVQSILDAFEILIVRQRELLNISADAGDEGTNALMSDYVREQEKLDWMYSAFLKKNKIIWHCNSRQQFIFINIYTKIILLVFTYSG